jgi:hypothetical protein
VEGFGEAAFRLPVRVGGLEADLVVTGIEVSAQGEG